MNPDAHIPSIDEEHELAGHPTVSVYGPYFAYAEGDNGTGVPMTTLGRILDAGTPTPGRHRAEAERIEPHNVVGWRVAKAVLVLALVFAVLAVL